MGSLARSWPNPPDSWGKFSEMMLQRFGPGEAIHINMALSQIKQLSSVADYIAQFIKLSCRVGLRTTAPRPKPGFTSVPSNIKTTTNHSRTPVHRKTQLELLERRQKGLCFHCDDPYIPGHHCKSPHILMI